MKREVIALVMTLLLVTSAQAISIFLSDTLDEGEGRIYQTNLGSYIVKLITVSDATGKVLFEVNNEKSRSFGLKESFKFKDGSEIVLMDLQISDTSTGNDHATFYFYGTGISPILAKNLSYDIIEENRCNFDQVCSGETQAWCCYDCGCDAGRCRNNKCIIDETATSQPIKEEKKEEPSIERPMIEVKDAPAITITPKRKARAISVVMILIAIGVLIPAVYLISQKKKRF
ncbi:MAG: hypothetical protein O2779_01340 [Nanoarchaeota archaeon]|nr:hypothetical protein [Nanoarchaeota archaeon]